MVVANSAMAQTRIVVIPLYTEEGREAKDGGAGPCITAGPWGSLKTSWCVTVLR